MKQVAAMIVVLGALSGSAIADNGPAQAPRLALAVSSDIAQQPMLNPRDQQTARKAHQRVEARTLNKALAQVSAELDRQLEKQITQGLTHAK